MAVIGTRDATGVIAPDRWLHGRWVDLFIGCGLGYVVLVPILLGYGYATGVQTWPIAAVTAFAMLINAPHYGATVLRVYESREDRAKYRFFALHATLALALVLAGASRSVWLASAIITIYITWSPWHFAGQNYGLALMFLRRRGVEVDAGTKRLFYLSFVLSAALAMLAIHGREAPFSVSQPTLNTPGAPRAIALGIPGNALVWLSASAGIAYLGCLAAVAWRLRGRGSASDQAPAWALVLTQALWFAVPAFATADPTSTWRPTLLPFAAIWVSTAHSLQYLWITAYYAKRSQSRDQVRSYLWKTLLAGTAVINVPILLFAPDLLGTQAWDAGLAMTTFSIVNIHHFILDGAIWKLRDGGIARVLLRPSAAPEANAGERSRRSGFAALVWTLAGLSLVLPAMVIFEEVGMLLDPTPERAATKQRHLRWIGRESVALHLAAGRESEENGRDESAIEHYRRSIELFPNAQGWSGLGDVYVRQKRLALALEAYEQAASLQPESPRLLFRRAQIVLALAENGTRPDPDRQQTMTMLRRVLELQPAHTPASLLLARLVASAGRRDDAVQILERAIEHRRDEPSPQLSARLAELRQADP